LMWSPWQERRSDLLKPTIWHIGHPWQRNLQQN